MIPYLPICPGVLLAICLYARANTHVCQYVCILLSAYECNNNPLIRKSRKSIRLVPDESTTSFTKLLCVHLLFNLIKDAILLKSQNN